MQKQINEKFFIAQIGRTVGLWGDLKLHLHTDFPEQFKVGNSYQSNRGELTISDINFKRGTIRFQGYESIDTAKKLTNTKLYADEAQTKELCPLEEGQHFWFDVIGCTVKQNDEVLGVVDDIQRLADVDYLSIKTDKALVDAGLPKNFLVPYIDRYMINTDEKSKIVHVKDAKDILEAS
ncbi:ribosome maturation factor RimM [Sulfurovum lithotrophicum]|uniref:Ribosome maturation factor RimM n=1 Tax=Sulfurovum lithotrophicum TaxID=206403 RepID=A0A7U4M295_9BACT|nr:ribosome maturation factor RimM [Sulfurovum lithotrophicum]AKF25553.1 ribosome maturation factor RimM [Sulfurovum lithotrophicum]